MGDAPLGLDLGPPDTAVADADPVDVQGFRDDHMVDAGLGEPAALGQIGHPAIAAGLLVHRPGNLDRAGRIDPAVHQGFDRDHGRGDPALHVAGAAAVDLAVPQHRRERVDGPALAGLDHVDVAVEMHTWARPAAFPAGYDIDPGIGVAVAGRAFGADIGDLETAAFQPLAQIFGARPIGVAGRVDSRKADQILGQGRQFVGAVFDPTQYVFKGRDRPKRLGHATAPIYSA